MTNEAMALLGAMYERRGMEFYGRAQAHGAHAARVRRLIPNPVSTAPGFAIGNVHVMAGVPQVFQAMLDAMHAGSARPATPLLSQSVRSPYGRRRHRHAR